MKQFEGDKEVAPGVRAIATYGHTPGHTSYQVSSGRNQMIVLGDVSNIPSLFVTHPDWRAVFDVDGALAETNRRKMYDRVVADGVTITGYHFGLPGAGKIKKDGKGYAFVPVKAA
jgi:glyoxylase-like metal-dependent hydrolase (beta-lactamase superfamily II)